MEDIAVAGQIPPRRPLAGPQRPAPVGNRIVQMQAAFAQLQPRNAPGGLITVLDPLPQIAVRRGHIHPYQHRLAGLIDLILSPHPDGRETLRSVPLPGPVHGLREQMVKTARTQIPVVEHGLQQFLRPAKRTSSTSAIF